ncbi:hypothetical protein PF008_g32947 [Phytophthora fragariae]|uniref:Uncharacterized protein n=1 Tax=Phytophthora fragariae TaxID=53985 RepID=A0A6G0PYB5_9STRA|nr:hypothetical protein PF008_g32947 [Phytophthora fragariae]
MPARSRCSCYCIARPVAVPDVMMLAESNAGQISLIGLLPPLAPWLWLDVVMLAESNAGQISLLVLLYIGVYSYK